MGFISSTRSNRYVTFNLTQMKKSEIKNLIREIIQEENNVVEAKYDPEISDLASECLSMLAHPFFRKFIEKTDDPQVTTVYDNLYELIKDYE